MKIELDLEDGHEDIERLVKALEHYHAYLVSQQRTDSRFKALAEMLKRKR
jgi:hypothetical protein